MRMGYFAANTVDSRQPLPDIRQLYNAHIARDLITSLDPPCTD